MVNADGPCGRGAASLLQDLVSDFVCFLKEEEMDVYWHSPVLNVFKDGGPTQHLIVCAHGFRAKEALCFRSRRQPVKDRTLKYCVVVAR